MSEVQTTTKEIIAMLHEAVHRQKEAAPPAPWNDPLRREQDEYDYDPPGYDPDAPGKDEYWDDDEDEDDIVD